MKLKRMAVVAAAAVVGPTVLMATPAMADEAQTPAVTTPDAAPKDDAAPAAETPAKDAKPAAETPAKPAAEKPAPAPAPAKPAAEKPASKPAPAPQVEDADEYKEGPKLGLSGLPAGGFKAGGDWTEVTLKVDNRGIQGFKDYGFAVLGGNDNDTLHAKHLDIQIYNGTKWVAADKDPSGQTAGTVFDSYVDEDEVFTVKLRMKFSKDAPLGSIEFVVAGGSNNVDEEFASDAQFYTSKIVRGSTGGGNTGGNTGGHNNGGNTGGNTGGNNNTKPNGGGTTTPIVDTNTGSGNTGGSTNTGGELAETGADAATSWALGAGGVALAMGAALVAGTGRRRRVTN
ncbi:MULTISPECIES: hypothetical protein [Streptomyces]|uniref:hypothetical protein n=1 Tax=Streptomyces TaxID=1883 RepID=UPI0001B54763|nr:hypothetical protein [Streptomyces sp. C]